MFGLLRDQSRSAAGAIWYVTVGTLLVIWAGLWYFYFNLPIENPPAWQRFVCVGTIFSGMAIVAIGLLFGAIGRGAKAADTTTSVAAEETVVPVAMAPAAMATPVSTSTGPVSVVSTASPSVR